VVIGERSKTRKGVRISKLRQEGIRILMVTLMVFRNSSTQRPMW